MSKTKENMGPDFVLDPESFGGTDFPDWKEVENIQSQLREEKHRRFVVTPKDVDAPLITPEEKLALDSFYKTNPQFTMSGARLKFEQGSLYSHKNEPWIQTYSGRRFNPTNPYVDAIVIQDIAHALSMQCRFSGHVKKFYSVAQHCVLVSYICDRADALWGLLHDASEAYLVDVPRPLKRSGKFDAYLEFENRMQTAICRRFGLPEQEPESVKLADKILLSTEARDLMGPLHEDWQQPAEPLPFRVDALPQQEAKNLFMKRFYELINAPGAYEHYLSTENRS